MHPKISVIIPAYHAQNTIARAIESVLTQTMQNFELIVVDDASSDGTNAIACQYADRDLRVHVIEQKKNKGVFLARKQGVRHANGDYCMFLDADDAYVSNACECAVRLIEQGQYDIAAFSLAARPASGVSVPQAVLEGIEKHFRPSDDTFDRAALMKASFEKQTDSFSLVNKIFRMSLCKRAYEALADIPISMGDDLLAFYAIAYFSESFRGYPKEVLYQYDVGGGMSTSQAFTFKRANAILEQFDVLDELEAFLQRQNASQDDKTSLDAMRRAKTDEMLAWESVFLRKCERTEGIPILKQCREKMEPLAFCNDFAQRFWNVPAMFYRLADGIFATQPENGSDREVRVIATYYPRICNGGVERVISQLIPVWTQMGYRVVLMTDEDAGADDYTIDAPYERVILPTAQTPETFGKRANALYDAIRKHKVDMMVYHAWLAQTLPWDMLVCRAAACCFAVYTHGALRSILPNVSPDLRRWVGQLPEVYQKTECVITLTGADDAFWKKRNCRVMPTVNPMNFDPPILAQPKQSCRRVLWLARSEALKQPLEAVRIMKNVLRKNTAMDFTMVLTPGDEMIRRSVYEALLRSDVAERVQLLDFQTDVIALYETHDVMLLTSSAEGFPMTLRESAAFGMPTVMYDLPCLFLRETDTGIVRVPQMDAAAAAEALLCLADDNAAFSALSQAALERDVQRRCVDQKQIWKSVFSGNVLQPAEKSNDPAEQMALEIDDAMRLAELSADEARLQMTAPKQTINYGTRYYFKHMVAAALLRVLGEKRWKRLYGAYAARQSR